jgi:hypothetical protein
MNTHLLKTTFIILLCSTLSFTAWANNVAITGPSDGTSAPPASAASVSQVLCAGSTISLKGPVDASNANYKRYQWYKLDSNGNKQLVKDSTDNSYTEVSDGAGYYTYQLVITNTNDCSSDISDPFKVYVLPTLTPTITAAGNVTAVCEKGASSTTLTANVSNTNFTYNYQWTRNGTDISGATSNTYTVTEQTAGDITFGVKVSYSLNSTCTQTATQTINVIALPTKPVIAAG